jgi:hypothetical protein
MRRVIDRRYLLWPWVLIAKLLGQLLGQSPNDVTRWRETIVDLD